MNNLPISVLELAIVNQNSNPKEAIENSMKVAQLADSLSYKRIWFAEHHNMPHVASSATTLLIQLAASQTQSIRVGSGGIMLPNHSPLIIAEQFGTLETLYPDRIDLGLGRAPGTDQATAQALRRGHLQNAQNFPNEIDELKNYFQPKDENQKINAYPGKGLNLPFYILGSSTSSALLAAEKGLPYAFATHFAPAQFYSAIELYRKHFQPSEQLKEPYIIACVNVIAADTDDEAHFLSTSLFNMFINMVTKQDRTGLMPPGEISQYIQVPEVRNAVDAMTAGSFIGNKESLEIQLNAFVSETKINEIMVTSPMYDIDAKLKSFRLVSELFADL
jgi:luciferase family oxidoreductase group 1